MAYVTEARVRELLQEYIGGYDQQLQQVLLRADQAQRAIDEKTSQITNYLQQSEIKAEAVRIEIANMEDKHQQVEDRVQRIVTYIKRTDRLPQ